MIQRSAILRRVPVQRVALTFLFASFLGRLGGAGFVGLGLFRLFRFLLAGKAESSGETEIHGFIVHLVFHLLFSTFSFLLQFSLVLVHLRESRNQRCTRATSRLHAWASIIHSIHTTRLSISRSHTQLRSTKNSGLYLPPIFLSSSFSR